MSKKNQIGFKHFVAPKAKKPKGGSGKQKKSNSSGSSITYRPSYSIIDGPSAQSILSNKNAASANRSQPREPRVAHIKYVVGFGWIGLDRYGHKIKGISQERLAEIRRIKMEFENSGSSLGLSRALRQSRNRSH
ncbi:MAG: hypothetical protein FWD33_04095 [Alphaproteobacteria bacterium]|nr:hypothetical protein [Alphaproteobacteria bacterium]